MTTSQTIDGVPREQMISFPRELGDALGELIANKARVCGGGAFDIWEAICEQFGTPSAEPQRIEYSSLDPVERLAVCRGEQPVAVVLPERLDLPHRDEFESADQHAAAVGEAKKWNECIDEVAHLNGVTLLRADPAKPS